MLRIGLVAVLLAGLWLAGCGGDDGDARPVGQAGAKKLRLVRVGSFDKPLYVTAVPGDRARIYVVEQDGRIRIVRNGRKVSGAFLDIRSKVTSGGEQGLLGLAFPPDHSRSGLFYVYYTTRDGRQRLSEFRRASATRADPGSERVLFTHDDPEPNHNGGQLAFGPDGLLYIGTGDGGGAGDAHGARGNAQNLGSPLGKILRIDPKGSPYTIPAGNPFADRSGARPEIYSYGLRNPWRFSFDRRTGDLAIGDVGQNEYEEIDFVRKGRGAGANFGWRPFEGTHAFRPGESAPDAISPVIEQTHGDGWCSITGGYIVRDASVRPLVGRYVYGDFCKGRIYAAKLSGGKASGRRALALPTVRDLSSFGEDAAGRVYVTSLSGPVYRLAYR